MFASASFSHTIVIIVCDTVEMIKQFPERVENSSLSFQGDVVYIGVMECVIQWNVVTDAVVRLEGYSGLK